MRYLDIETAPRLSKIGLGTWQFGSTEWGYGKGYAGREARDIVRRAVELGVTLFDTAEIYGLGRSERILGEALGDQRASVFLATKLFPALPLAPVVEQRAVASANRLGARHSRPVPGALAEPAGLRRHDHAGDERAATGRAGRGGRRQQLPAGPLAGRREGARRAGAEQPGAVQPRRPRARAGPAAVRRQGGPGRDHRSARWPRACCPASTTAPTARRTGSGPGTRCSCRRTWAGPAS